MFLVLDNYDSFTYTIVYYLTELGVKPKTIVNDEYSLQEIKSFNPLAILISPGPGTPKESGVSCELVQWAKENKIPLLGICLGMQVIAENFGGDVVLAPQVKHGKISQISHNKKGIFASIPSPFAAVRYHSLVVDNLPKELSPTAQTNEGLIMALEHKNFPIFGVQFHPESILTEYGFQLFDNFLKMSSLK